MSGGGNAEKINVQQLNILIIIKKKGYKNIVCTIDLIISQKKVKLNVKNTYMRSIIQATYFFCLYNKKRNN